MRKVIHFYQWLLPNNFRKQAKEKLFWTASGFKNVHNLCIFLGYVYPNVIFKREENCLLRKTGIV